MAEEEACDMSEKRIRNSAKALIIEDGRMLASRIENAGGYYYVMPGGGQEPDEVLSETVRRECAEELGLHVEPLSLAFVVERTEGESFHRIDFVFACRPAGAAEAVARHLDEEHAGYEWLPIDTLETVPLYPVKLRHAVRRYHAGEQTEIYLGHDL